MAEILKVSSKSAPNAVAGALAGLVRTVGRAEIQVVGAGAVNQAVKAIAIARTYLAPAGQDLCCRPTFADIEIDGERRTAVRLLIECADPDTDTDPGHPDADPGRRPALSAPADEDRAFPLAGGALV